MGTILQERVAPLGLERVSIRDREWKRRAAWSTSRPNVASNKMGRRQSQRRSAQPQYAAPSQENDNEKRLQQRRKHKPHASSTKRSAPQHSAQGTSELKSGPAGPAEDGMEPKVQPSAQRCREHGHSGLKGSRHTAALPRRRLSASSSHQLEGGGLRGHQLEGGGLRGHQLEGGGLRGHQLEGGGLSGHQLDGGGLSGHQLDGGGLSSHQLDGGGLSSHQLDGGGLSGQQLDGGGLSSRQLDGGGLSGHQLDGGGLSGHTEEDSDTDLSESERLPVSRSSRVPPELELRPEVIEAEECSSHSHRTRGQNRGGLDFPDFLPPPFNSWSLSQLAVFYNTEGRGAPRPRPVGPLERYLERLLQLEWRQIQTVQEETGKSALSEVLSSCHKPSAAVSSRLSSPKCILQCQRAFPLTFLSSLAGHSALLSGCGCTLCRIRYSACSASCCRSAHGHARPSRLSPTLERSRGPVSLPKRSYSESRVHSSDRSSRAQRFCSPARNNSHLRRMQASGNIRTPAQGATTRPHSTARDCSDGAGRGDGSDHRMGGFSRRSGSEQRRGGGERLQSGSEKRRSGSECRRAAERKRAAESKEIKPDAVAAIMDNLPGSKYSPIRRPGRHRQVEFVT